MQEDDLARLAREGRQKIETQSKQRAELELERGETHVRVALGVHYGSPRKRIPFVVMMLGIVGTLAVAFREDTLPYMAITLPMLLYGALALGLLEPSASEERIAEERAFVSKQPFTVTGYFESLAKEPVPQMRLVARARFRGEIAPSELVRDVVGRVDPEAEVQGTGDELVVSSSAISGATGIRQGHVWIYRNHKLVPWLHQMVEEVFVPVHSRYPIESVEFERRV